MINHTTITGKTNKAIFFVHGNSQSGKSWRKLSDNDNLSEFTKILIDLPGHGESEWSTTPSNSYDLISIGKEIQKLITTLNYSEYILVANSLGCNIVCEVILKLAGCKGLVLSGSTTIGLGLNLSDLVCENENINVCFSEEYTEAELNDLINAAVHKPNKEMSDQIRTDFINTDPKFRSHIAENTSKGFFTDELDNLNKSHLPVAFVYGEKEQICKINALEQVALNHLWKNKSHVISNSAHCNQIDQPTEFAKLIRSFIDDVFV